MRRNTNMAMRTVPHGVRLQAIEARARTSFCMFSHRLSPPRHISDSFRTTSLFHAHVRSADFVRVNFIYILLIYGEAKAQTLFLVHFLLTKPRLSERRSSPVNVRCHISIRALLNIGSVASPAK